MLMTVPKTCKAVCENVPGSGLEELHSLVKRWGFAPGVLPCYCWWTHKRARVKARGISLSPRSPPCARWAAGGGDTAPPALSFSGLDRRGRTRTAEARRAPLSLLCPLLLFASPDHMTSLPGRQHSDHVTQTVSEVSIMNDCLQCHKHQSSAAVVVNITFCLSFHQKKHYQQCTTRRCSTLISLWDKKGR